MKGGGRVGTLWLTLVTPYLNLCVVKESVELLCHGARYTDPRRDQLRQDRPQQLQARHLGSHGGLPQANTPNFNVKRRTSCEIGSVAEPELFAGAEPERNLTTDRNQNQNYFGFQNRNEIKWNHKSSHRNSLKLCTVLST